MNQQDILEILRANGPLTVREIHEITDLDISSIRSKLAMLQKWGDVERLGVDIQSNGRSALLFGAVA